MEMSNQKLTFPLQSISPTRHLTTWSCCNLWHYGHHEQSSHNGTHVLWNWQHKGSSQCKGVDGGAEAPEIDIVTLYQIFIQIDLLHCFACVLPPQPQSYKRIYALAVILLCMLRSMSYVWQPHYYTDYIHMFIYVYSARIQPYFRLCFTSQFACLPTV